MQLSLQCLTEFRSTVWSRYRQHRRDMPWREKHDFYRVLVSEMMLQQTQVSRVIPKFEDFIKRFPTVESLADATLADVLIAWQGLGYNRRAKFLHQAARHIVAHGTPLTRDELTALPGVGSNTAGAILAYAYNQPAVFIETNIRTVFIHEFFREHTHVDDCDIRPLVEASLDTSSPREWYWALMDYGAHLKSRSLGAISVSRQYKKQSRFDGSVRQARGAIVRILADGPHDVRQLEDEVGGHFDVAYRGLMHDGLIERHSDVICLTAHTEPS